MEELWIRRTDYINYIRVFHCEEGHTPIPGIVQRSVVFNAELFLSSCYTLEL